MNRYHLKGVDRKTGKERELTVSAESETEAVAAANEQRMMVARVRLDSATQSTALPEHHDPRLADLDPAAREVRELRLDLQSLRDDLVRRTMLREPVIAMVGAQLLAALVIAGAWVLIGAIVTAIQRNAGA